MLAEMIQAIADMKEAALDPKVLKVDNATSRKRQMIRCSSLPLISKCPAAAQQPQYAVRQIDESAANVGSAVHLAMEQVASRGQSIPAACEQAAWKYHVDVNDVRVLVYLAAQVWESIKEFFPAPHFEVELATDDMALVGHPDVVSYDDMLHRVSILDYKSGRVDFDHRAQVVGYAYLAMQKYPEAESAYVAVARVREQVIDGVILSREEVEKEIAGILEAIKRPTEFIRGEHCRYCPRSHECPAKTQIMAQAAVSLAPWAKSLPTDRAPEVMANVLEQCKLLEDAIAAARWAIKTDVHAAGGSIQLSDGREIVLVEQERSTIDYCIGEDVLRKYVGDVLPSALEVGIGKLKKIVGRKGGGRAVSEMYDELEQCGAITTTVVDRLEVRRHERLAGVLEPAAVNDSEENSRY